MGLTSTNVTTWPMIPKRCGIWWTSGEKRPAVDDMRARLYELMNQFDDPFGDLKNSTASMRGDRYCAPRYLPRGKRLPV